MKLLTKELEAKFAAQGDCSEKKAKDIQVIAKFFNPTGAGTWFLSEWIPEDRVFFGFANLGDPEMAELGYVSLDELESFKGVMGLGIERDLHFKGCTLQEVIDKRGMMI